MPTIFDSYYKCGHQVAGIAKFGKLCRSCWEDKKLEIIKRISDGDELSILRGSPKQRKWCVKIRYDKIKELEKILQGMYSPDGGIIKTRDEIKLHGFKSLALHEYWEYSRQYEFVAKIMEQYDDCGWWISKQNKQMCDIVNEVFEDFRNEITAHVTGKSLADPADAFGSDWI